MTDNEQTIEVAWVTDTLVPGDTPTNADNVTWPQPLATGTECGEGWLQIDTYLVDAVPALTSDGQLTYGEDFDVVLEWRFEPLPACEEPEPTPTPEPTPNPEPPLVCPEGTVPGWLDEAGNPTSCVSNDPQPTPEPSPSPTPQPPTVETQPPAPTTPDQPQLAETGFDPLLTVVALAAILAGITLIRLRRTR